MIVKTYNSSIKTLNKIKSASDTNIEVLPSCHKVILTNLTSAGGATDIVKVEACIESDFALVTKGGTSGATTTTRVANTFVSNLSSVYGVGATGVAVGANVITITTSTPLPTTLVGAPVRIRYSGKDPLSLALPSMMYITLISGNSVSIQIDKLSSWPSASVSASGLEVLSSPRLKKNLPVSITAVTVTGDKAVFHGSFPSADVTKEATLQIPNHSACVSTSVKGKDESLRFVIEASDVSAGTLTVSGVKGKLISMTAGSDIITASLDKEGGFGVYFADEEGFYNKVSPIVSIADAGFANGDEILIEQLLAGC